MIIRISPSRKTLLALLILPLLLLSGNAWGQALFDFEQPYFVAPKGLQCKDHSVIKIDDLYHVFYIESFPPSNYFLRTEAWLGHMTSPDLRHWSRVDSILPVSEMPNSWEEFAIWAPKILRNPEDDKWFLFYTGVNDEISQQTGMAYSYDAHRWYRWPFNPIYHPGDWSNWTSDDWGNCRDPEIFRMDGSPDYYLLNTSSTSAGDGAISLAVSQNMVAWQDLDPLFINDSSAVLESVQLLYYDELYHLFFTEQGVQGTSHMISPTLEGNWSKDNLTIIDVGNAPEITRLDDEDLFSRHNAVTGPDGVPIYYYHFSNIDLETPNNVPDVINLDGLSDKWTIVFGSAFDNQPTWGDNSSYRDAPSHLEGNAFLSTYEDFSNPVTGVPGATQGNLTTGLLRSEPFVLTEDRLSLLVGGGDLPGRCFVALFSDLDDTLCFLESGNDSFAMTPRLWDCSSLIGETVYLVVADLAYHETHAFISVDSIREYLYDGFDPIPPALPVEDGPSLYDILEDAGFNLTDVHEPSAVPAIAARLLAPYPNPFNPHTRLRYELKHSGQVDLDILDSSGRKVRTLHSGPLDAGPGFFTWDGRNNEGQSLASGCYFARLRLDSGIADTRKLMLVR
ncbi:MAG: hypothetical protein GY835_04330 [bacterium]|nr:hypothetical protein [bacterium]